MSKNIFIPTTAKKNSDDSALQEDAALFVTWNNPKTGDSYRLLNLEHDSLAPRQGIIELKPIKVTKRHDNAVGFRLLNDQEYDCLIGIPINFDHKTGAPIWQKINISNHETYDLSIKSQRQEWICIKRSPYYTDVINGTETNPNFDSGMKAQYKAIDKEREANQFARTRKEKRRAEDIADALLDNTDQLKEMAYSINKDPKGISIQRLWMEVVKYAVDKPEEFMAIYNSDTKAELAVLKRGLLTGVLQDSLSEGTNFNGLTLGHKESECVAFLKEHPQTMASIHALNLKKDKETESSMKKSTPVTVTNASELLKDKRIAELEERLKALTSEKSEEVAERILENVDPVRADLVARGKRLRLQGVHMIKDIEQLREKVESAEKLKVN